MYQAIYVVLNLIIYQVDIIYAYVKSLLNNNKYSIFMKLPQKINQLRQI